MRKIQDFITRKWYSSRLFGHCHKDERCQFLLQESYKAAGFCSLLQWWERFKLTLVEVNKAVLQKSAVDFLQLWLFINEPAWTGKCKTHFPSGVVLVCQAPYLVQTMEHLMNWLIGCFTILDIKTFSPFSCQAKCSQEIIID